MGAVRPSGTTSSRRGPRCSPASPVPPRSRSSTAPATGPLRLRGEGLRSDPVDREEGCSAHGPVLAADPRCGSTGRAGLRDRRRQGAGPHRRLRRHGHRRPQVAAGLIRHAASARAGSRQPVLDPAIIPNMGAARVSVGSARKAPLSSRCTACAASKHGDRRIARRDQARARGRDARRRHEAPITPIGIAGFSAMRAPRAATTIEARLAPVRRRT